MDRRLKKDLVEQGILSVEDLSKNMPDDEILQEIKKCQQELAAVNEYNVEELKRLKAIVTKDLKRQEIKAALDKVDNQVGQPRESKFPASTWIRCFRCWRCTIKFC
jgi:transcriptional adapter 3